MIEVFQLVVALSIKPQRWSAEFQAPDTQEAVHSRRSVGGKTCSERGVKLMSYAGECSKKATRGIYIRESRWT